MKLTFWYVILFSDINECSSDPCNNGGTCKDLVNKYECTCVAGYDGMNCHNS
jgi:Notch-like protein